MSATEHVHNLGHKKDARRQLRSHATQAEGMLWRALQRSQLAGRKLRRQHGIGPYIVDFYCPSEKLVIELDGAGHFTVSGEAHDVVRTDYLNSLGLRVLRFENRSVLQQVDGVLAAIQAAFLVAGDDEQRLSTTPSPSSSEEGN
jgi:very-short-patch-repair endonuclease